MIGEWSKFTGYDKREMHAALAGYFLPAIDDAGRLGRDSTADMDAETFRHYVDDCRRLAAERYDVYIPDPNEGASHD